MQKIILHIQKSIFIKFYTTQTIISNTYNQSIKRISILEIHRQISHTILNVKWMLQIYTNWFQNRRLVNNAIFKCFGWVMTPGFRGTLYVWRRRASSNMYFVLPRSSVKNDWVSPSGWRRPLPLLHLIADNVCKCFAPDIPVLVCETMHFFLLMMTCECFHCLTGTQDKQFFEGSSSVCVFFNTFIPFCYHYDFICNRPPVHNLVIFYSNLSVLYLHANIF